MKHLITKMATAAMFVACLATAPNVNADVQIIGGINNGSWSDNGPKMSENSLGNYVIKKSLPQFTGENVGSKALFRFKDTTTGNHYGATEGQKTEAKWYYINTAGGNGNSWKVDCNRELVFSINGNKDRVGIVPSDANIYVAGNVSSDKTFTENSTTYKLAWDNDKHLWTVDAKLYGDCKFYLKVDGKKIGAYSDYTLPSGQVYGISHEKTESNWKTNAEGTYTIEYDGVAIKATLKEEPTELNYYLQGALGVWSDNDNIKFQKQGDGTYKLTLNNFTNPSSGFKVHTSLKKDDNNGYYNVTGDNIISGNGNYIVSGLSDKSGDVTFTLTVKENGEPASLSATYKVIEPEHTVYLVGTIGKNSYDNDLTKYRLTLQEDGTYVIQNAPIYNEGKGDKGWFRFKIDGTIYGQGSGIAANIGGSHNNMYNNKDKSWSAPYFERGYDIVVSGDFKWFTIKRSPLKLTAPESLYLETNYVDNWNKGDKALKFEKNGNVFSVTIDNYSGNDLLFRMMSDNKMKGNDASNWTKIGTSYYPDGNPTEIEANTAAEITNAKTVSSDPGNHWKYNSGKAGKVTIMVDFSKVPATVTVNQSILPANAWILAGDVNDWFDYTRFDSECPEADKTAHMLKWMFKEVEDTSVIPENLRTYNGKNKTWYVVTPDNEQKKIWGQFKIFNGKWNNENDDKTYDREYTYDVAINTGDVNYLKNDESYWAQEINENQVVNVYKTDKDNYDKHHYNMHLAHNAYVNSKIYFCPDFQDERHGRLLITGTPRDYYIFYGIENDVKQNHKLRVKINADNPNTYNYAFNTNNDADAHLYTGNGGLLPFTKIDSDVEEIDAAENGINNSGIDTDNFYLYNREGKFPTGHNYRNVYVAKIPNGFEGPAGKIPMNISVNKLLNENGVETDHKLQVKETNTININNDHIFIFDNFRIHAQLNEEIFGENATIEYRIYGYNDKYEFSYVDSDDNSETYGEFKAFTSEHAGEGTGVNKYLRSDIGWVKLDQSKNSSDFPSIKKSGNWNVSIRNGNIREVPVDHSTAYIQYRITTEQPVGGEKAIGRERAAADGKYEYIIPEKFFKVYPADFPNAKEVNSWTKGQGNDIYVTPGIETGVDDILVDDTMEVEEVYGAPVYYNLQGVRVANPERGIYIKVTGNKSEKVMF
ncbi:MAG: hypothetical protein NC311_15800 [Muribaculaceae bacterium]|nr:hypothetical protein [Muribaculaceae bacterium]